MVEALERGKCMKNAYIAISYVCNENCSFCPCTKKEKSDKLITKLEDLTATIDDMEINGITDITLSGGEPTLHPKLPELIKYIQDKGISVTILSNGERFSSEEFVRQLALFVDMKRLRVITTLHSSDESEHENANQTIGSFRRSIIGLKLLSELGVRIIIKHCITKQNYKDLTTFYKFCNEYFPSDVDVQLCSIDYCGIPENYIENEKLLFCEVKPYLEELFEYDLQLKKSGSKRKLYCINMPLCSCDPYYWKYMPRSRDKMYDQYKDPHTNKVIKVSDNVGTHEEYCSDCKVKNICCGTYHTAYEICGKSVIKPYV